MEAVNLLLSLVVFSQLLICPCLSVKECLLLHLRDGQGNVITSPLYPSSYPSDVCFTWWYNGSPGTVFTLWILGLDLPGKRGECSLENDNIRIGPLHEQILCGKISQPEQVYSATVSSHVYIIFNSTRRSHKGRGFKAQFKITKMLPIVLPSTTSDIANSSVVGDGKTAPVAGTNNRLYPPTEPGINLGVCLYKYTSLDGEIVLKSSMLPSLKSTHQCRWSIQPLTNYEVRIKLSFIKCGLGPNDKLYVRNEDGTVLGLYRSWQCPQVITSTYGQLEVLYIYGGGTADPSLVMNYHTVSAVPSTTALPARQDGSLKPDSLVFDYPNCDHIMKNVTSGELSGPLVSPDILQRCGGQLTWLVQANRSSNNVNLRVWLDSCPHYSGQGYENRIEVFDGKNSSSPLLLSCNSATGGASLEASTSGDIFFVRYHTYNPFTQRRFHLKFSRQGGCFHGLINCLDETACYHPAARCNGSWECPQHGSDELNCDLMHCPAGTFMCGEETHYCFNEKDRCNGKGTCTNYRDEMNCDSTRCNHYNGLFLCNDGRCIYEKWRCDGTSDCADNSDEDGCTFLTSPRVIVAAVVGSLTCSLILVLAVGLVCRMYRMRYGGHPHHHSSHRCHRSGHSGPCCPGVRGHHHHHHHDSPLTRQIAEMFRHRVPPPPYHEAMLTSRPYREGVNQMIGEGDSQACGDSNAFGGGEGATGSSISMEVRRSQAGAGSSRDEDLHAHRSSCQVGSRPRRQHRQQHREITQGDLPVSPQLIEVGTLPRVPGMSYVGDIVNCIDNPPPYSEAVPQIDACHNDSDAEASQLGEVEGEGIVLRPQRRRLTNEGQSGEVMLAGDIPNSEPQDRDGETFKSIDSDESNGIVTSPQGTLHAVEEDSDSDCILRTEDDEFKDEEEEDGEEDEDEDEEEDSEDSDTACLLSVV